VTRARQSDVSLTRADRASSIPAAIESSGPDRFAATRDAPNGAQMRQPAIARSTRRDFSFRQADGLMPKRRWNALVKWLLLAKPTCTAVHVGATEVRIAGHDRQDGGRRRAPRLIGDNARAGAVGHTG
jgi:hypothetical protein